MITVRRPSGLAVPFEPPELTSDAAIERSWEVRVGQVLLEPKRPEFLPTEPRLLPAGWTHWWFS